MGQIFVDKANSFKNEDQKTKLSANKKLQKYLKFAEKYKFLK